MKKSNWFAISLVVLAVFNLIAFTAPFNKTSTFWIGYIFGTIAVLLHLLVSQKTLNAGKELKSRFYGWPLMIVASIYMTVQIILSLLFMLASSIDAWISLIISALCLAICMIGMISGEGAKEIIEKTDVKVNEKVFFIKSLESDIHLLSASCNDAATKKNIVALEDAIRFSDPTVRPDLVDEWHPTKNGDLTPDTVLAHSYKEVVWFGKCGHEWSSSVACRVKGTGCPYCNNDKVLKGFNDLATTHPSLAAEWHPIKNDFMPDSVTAGSHKSVVWLGKCGHEWVTTVNARTSRKYGCPFCSNHKLLKGFNDFATRFPDVAKEWHPTKNGALTPSDFMLSQGKAWWLCPVCGHEWEAFVKSRARGVGCPACANRRKSKHSKTDDVLKK